jgi:HD-GYP domain-containing protein (c-di-GMP phosphodiesterase class II)
LCAGLGDQAHAAAKMGTVALGFTRSFFEQQAFGVICAAAAVPCASAAEALRPFTHEDRGSLERVLQLLQWTAGDLAHVDRDRNTLEQFSNRMAQAFEETNLLFRLAPLLNLQESPSRQLERVCGELQQILPFGWVAIRFAKQQSAADGGLMGKTVCAGKAPFNVADFEQSADALIAGGAKGAWPRILSPADSAIAGLCGQEVLGTAITRDGWPIGALMAGDKRGIDREMGSEEMQLMEAAAEFLGAVHANASRFAEQRAMFLGTVRALSATIDAKDPYTRGHSERVALLSSQMASFMGLGERLVEWYHVSGLLHDLGKVAVPEAVLCKPGQLTEDEIAIVRRHPEIGYRILKDIAPIREALPGVLYHHERWDGTGYPFGLAGENIPLIARVMALADTFDAMCSNRAYRGAMPREQVLAEVHCCGGTQFDPKLAPMFVAMDFAAFDRMLMGHQPRLAA